MRLIPRPGSGTLLVGLLALAACASQPKQAAVSPAKSATDDQGLGINVYDSLFEVPSNKSAKSAWIAYGGFRLLWEDKHYPVMPKDYLESPEETLDSMDFMAQTWAEDQNHRPGEETYLDTLAAVRQAGYLKEYIWDCMSRDGWGAPPAGLRHKEFSDWMLTHATNFNVYEWAQPSFRDGKVSIAVHEPIAVAYCMPPDAATPKTLSQPDANAKIEAALKLLQGGGSEQMSSLLDEAVTSYDAAIAKQGGTPRCFYTVAEYYGYRNQHPGEHTLAVDATYCDAVHVQGYVQSGMRNWDAARNLLQREHELSPYGPGAVTELGFVTQGSAGPGPAVAVYWDALRLAEAEVAHKPEMTGILRRLGEAYIDLKKYDEARGALNAALLSDPNDAGTKRELQYLEQVDGKH